MAGSKLVLEGRVSVKSFLLGLSVLVIPLIRTSFGHLDWVFDYLTETSGKIVICVHIAATNGLLLLIYRGPLYKVSSAVDQQLGSSTVPAAAGPVRCGRASFCSEPEPSRRSSQPADRSC